VVSKKRRAGRRARGALLFIAGCLIVAGCVWAVERASHRHPMGIAVARPDAGLPSIAVVYAGFDVRDYPGDAVMRKLKRDAPYSFVGYYLESPNHPGASWMGAWRSTLAEMGWGVAILYVGQQGSALTEAQGMADADDAAAKAAGEGFPDGAIVFLDIEPMDEVSEAMTRYAAAWTKRIARNEKHAFRAGVYCHVRNAPELREALGEITYWVAGGPAEFNWTWEPAKSGVPFARLWQGQLDDDDPSGTVSFAIDVSTSLDRNPSGF
jgi:hypothetical protein